MPTFSFSSRAVRIGSALVIALAMVGVAYALSGPNLFSSQIARATSTEELLTLFAQKDTDGDGLPDWQEGLYGTDPADARSFRSDLTDGEAYAQGLLTPKFQSDTSGLPVDPDSIPGVSAAPGTVTDTFARELFQKYMAGRSGTPPTTEEVNVFLGEALRDLAARERAVSTYSIANVRVEGAGADALRGYLAALETAYDANAAGTDRAPHVYFADAVQKDSTADLRTVRQISASYIAIARAMASVSVPREAQGAHLSLINATAYMGQVTGNLGTYDTDPMRAMIGVIEYEGAVDSYAAAHRDLYAVLRSANIALTPGDRGYSIYESGEKITGMLSQ